MLKFISQKDKQAHFFAMLALLLFLNHFPALPGWLICLVGAAGGLLWELQNYFAKRKDFGELKNEVRYDWPDVIPFAAAIFLFIVFKIII